MKGAPYFPFFPSDFLGGTAFMSAEEVGCYMRLLCLQWQTGGIPNDQAQIERVTGAKFTPQVAAKFHLGKDGILRNRRLEEDRKELVSKSEKAKKSAANRWNGKALGGHANALRTHSERICETHAPQQCERNANQNQNHTSTIVDGAAALKLDGVPVFPTKDGQYEVPLLLAEDLQTRLVVLTAPEMIDQFHNAYYWLSADEGRLKTRRGMPLFFSNWMTRAAADKQKKMEGAAR